MISGSRKISPASPWTFWNSSVVAPSVLRLRLERGESDETALEALRGWIADGLEARESVDPEERRRDWQRARTRRAIINTDPSLRQSERGHLERVERLLATAIARDTGGPPEGLLPQMAASAAVAVFVMLERTRPVGEGPLTAREGLALVDRVLTFLHGGMTAVSGADQT